MGAIVLAVNPGSSSQEYTLYDQDKPIMSAYYEHAGHGFSVSIDTQTGATERAPCSQSDFEDSLEHFLALAKHNFSISPADIKGVGVRVVAPGRRFLSHQLFDQNLYSHMEDNRARAPIHIGATLRQVDKTRISLPGATIFAVSDSEFHGTLSHEARNYAIPTEDAHKYDIYRFGYHGLSNESVVCRLRDGLNAKHQKMIVCHLGSGASVTAIKDWQSIDTSMGYSPLEGLVMSTRSGSIDVEAAIELKRSLKFDDSQLSDYLNHQSGLSGLSGVSSDIRELLELEATQNHEGAMLALSSMAYRVRQYIGAYYAVLGGLDAIVMTATIGERSARTRQRILEPLSHLGVDLDHDLNNKVDSEFSIITKDSSKVTVYVVPSEETSMIAKHTLQMLESTDDHSTLGL